MEKEARHSETYLNQPPIVFLTMIADGLTREEIATKTQSTLRKTKKRIDEMKDFLLARTDTHAVVRGIELGLLEIDDYVSKSEVKKVGKLSDDEKETLTLVALNPHLTITEIYIRSGDLTYSTLLRQLRDIYAKLELPKKKRSDHQRTQATLAFLSSRGLSDILGEILRDANGEAEVLLRKRKERERLML